MLRIGMVAVAILLTVGVTRADSISFEFDGTADVATGVFAGTTSVSGSFSYNTDAAGTVLIANKLVRFASPGPLNLDITVSAASQTFSTGTKPYLSDTVFVQNDLPTFALPLADLIVFRSSTTNPVPAGNPRTLYVFFEDSQATAFGGLPGTIPASLNLADFDRVGGVILFTMPATSSHDFSVTSELDFSITSLRPVPEPGTFFLIGLAAIGLIVRLRRGRPV